MSRAYKGIRLKKNRVYSVQDLMMTYNVTQNTISNWVKSGLRPSDDVRPYVFRGAAVISFHAKRRARSRNQLRPGEFKCVACKMAVFPTSVSVDCSTTKSGALLLAGVCPDCAASVHRLGSERDLAVLSNGQIPNTNQGHIHEDKRSVPSCVGIDDNNLGSVNDRTIYRWQTFAGRYSEKTVDRHLESIRFMEDTIDKKRFERLTTEDVAKFRSALKRALEGGGKYVLSKSTVQHHASHVCKFLEWLLKQDGFKRLPSDLPDYTVLPKAAYAASIPPEARPYPSVESAREMLLSMPDQTSIQKRNKAIFALAFLGALRADTLISLRFGDIDFEQRRITQDARRARTKNGKSLIIAWFPLPAEFETALLSWWKVLSDAGFEADDALFPDSNILEHEVKYAKKSDVLITTMRSKHAVTQAFRIASSNCERIYTPHSAKHTIAYERGKRSLTDEQRRAWSLNMGHEREQITEVHYAKMSDERRFHVLESITDETPAEQTDLLSRLTDEQLGACFRQVLHKS